MSLMPMMSGDPEEELYRQYGGLLGAPGGGLLGGQQQAAPAAPAMQAPASQSFGQRLGAGLKSFAGNRDLALALLANSGYGPKQSFGQILGKSALMADQMKSQRDEDAFKRQYMTAQMAAMAGKNNQPSSVQEYEYARQNGYKGSFQEWTTAAGQTSRPSSVQEWEFYNALPQDQKQLYLEMKRNPNFKIHDVNKAPTAIVGTPGGRFSATPLSTTASEAAAAGQVKSAEAQGGAIGGGVGGIQAGITKKGADATTVMGLIDEAEKILPEATGSLVGTGVDKAVGAFGMSTKGAQASARLKIIQASLMTNMPRMEGPQSDRDVELYQQAAAQVGDSTVPVKTREAALKTIRDLQQKYVDRAKQPFQLFPNGTQTNDGWTVLPGGIKIREKK